MYLLSVVSFRSSVKSLIARLLLLTVDCSSFIAARLKLKTCYQIHKIIKVLPSIFGGIVEDNFTHVFDDCLHSLDFMFQIFVLLNFFLVITLQTLILLGQMGQLLGKSAIIVLDIIQTKRFPTEKSLQSLPNLLAFPVNFFLLKLLANCVEFLFNFGCILGHALVQLLEIVELENHTSKFIMSADYFALMLK